MFMDSPFRIWRRSRGLTQKQAADDLFIDVKTVQRYEAGDRNIPGPVALLMTLAAGGVDIEVEPWPDDDPIRAHEMLTEIASSRPPPGPATAGLETAGPQTAGHATVSPATAGLETVGPETVGPAVEKTGLLRRLLG